MKRAAFAKTDVEISHLGFEAMGLGGAFGKPEGRSCMSQYLDQYDRGD
jgi:hypothetical protein